MSKKNAKKGKVEEPSSFDPTDYLRNKISFKDFLIYGVPVTIVSLIAASLYVSLRYYQLDL